MADGGEQVVEILGRVDITWYEIIYLIVGEISLFFARVDQLFYVCKFIF